MDLLDLLDLGDRVEEEVHLESQQWDPERSVPIDRHMTNMGYLLQAGILEIQLGGGHIATRERLVVGVGGGEERLMKETNQHDP